MLPSASATAKAVVPRPIRSAGPGGSGWRGVLRRVGRIDPLEELAPRAPDPDAGPDPPSTEPGPRSGPAGPGPSRLRSRGAESRRSTHRSRQAAARSGPGSGASRSDRGRSTPAAATRTRCGRGSVRDSGAPLDGPVLGQVVERDQPVVAAHVRGDATGDLSPVERVRPARRDRPQRRAVVGVDEAVAGRRLTCRRAGRSASPPDTSRRIAALRRSRSAAPRRARSPSPRARSPARADPPTRPSGCRTSRYIRSSPATTPGIFAAAGPSPVLARRTGLSLVA